MSCLRRIWQGLTGELLGVTFVAIIVAGEALWMTIQNRISQGQVISGNAYLVAALCGLILGGLITTEAKEKTSWRSILQGSVLGIGALAVATTIVWISVPTIHDHVTIIGWTAFWAWEVGLWGTAAAIVVISV